MPTNQQLVEQAIRDYQTLLRQNGGTPAGLGLTSEIGLSQARGRIKNADTVTQADIDAYKRQVLVNEIAKGRERSQFPETFFPRDQTSLAQHLETRLSFDQQDIIKRGEIRAQAQAAGLPDPLKPGTVAANAPLLSADVRQSVDDATRATIQRSETASQLAAMERRDTARGIAQAAQEAPELARRVIEGISRDIAATRAPTAAAPAVIPLSAAPPAGASDEFAALLRQPFKPSGRDSTANAGDAAFLQRQTTGVVAPPVVAPPVVAPPVVTPPPAVVPPAVPDVAPHTTAVPHTASEPHVGGTRSARGGIIPALAIGAGVGVYSMLNGASPAQAAVHAGTVAADGLVPDVSTGFSGMRGANVRTVDRILNGLDTATGTVATGAALASLVPGAQPVSFPTAAIAGTANVGVGLLRDAAYVTGAADQGGIITAGVSAVMDANAQRALISKTTQALQAGRTAPGTERIADLRDSYLQQVQQVRGLDQYDPNHRDNLRKSVQAPPPYKDPQTGQVLTNLRDIRSAMSIQASELQRQYAQAVVTTGKENPQALAQLTGDAAPVKPELAAAPERAPTAAPSLSAQFGANITAVTDPNLSTKAEPPAVNIPVVAAAAEKKPEPASPHVAAAPTAHRQPNV